jgi:hypothetical protein
MHHKAGAGRKQQQQQHIHSADHLTQRMRYKTRRKGFLVAVICMNLLPLNSRQDRQRGSTNGRVGAKEETGHFDGSEGTGCAWILGCGAGVHVQHEMKL